MFRNSLCFLLATLCALAPVPPAAAHDSWIAKGQFRGPLNGEWCCGDHDCVVIPAQSVKPNGIGYDVASHAETVPYKEVLPSMDGNFWRCHRPDGSRRCFFAPPIGY